MSFDPKLPMSGQKLEDFLTIDYFKRLHAAIQDLERRVNVGGGPGVTVTKFGNKTTIKAARRSGGGGGGIPDTETIPIYAGTGDNEGKWVTLVGELELPFDCLEVDVCADGVEKKARILIGLYDPETFGEEE